MDLGRELVACALREQTLRPFLEAGITAEWLADQRDPSRLAIFADEQDRDAYRLLLNHWDRHLKVPADDIFRRSFPAEAYRLPDSGYSVAELIEIFQADRRRFITELAIGDLAELVARGEIDSAVELLELTNRTIRATHTSNAVRVLWDTPDYDVEGRINRVIKAGIWTGIPGLDGQPGWYGFQRGNLVCYLGRAKAGKTSFALLSAIRAWLDGKRVLFVTFEIAAGKDPAEPGVADRLDCFGAGVSLTRYMQGGLDSREQAAVRDLHKDGMDEVFRIIQPTGRYTPADLEDEIDKHQPDVVYVDGFYFMTDPETGKTGANWEGHDNLAAALKRTAMNWAIPVVITHQVREKQLTGKKGGGIDDGAMMGGTGIIMFADLVLGFDTDAERDHLRTISCTRSRLQYLTTVYGRWDWQTCEFNEQAAPYDEDKFAKGDDDDNPPF